MNNDTDTSAADTPLLTEARSNGQKKISYKKIIFWLSSGLACSSAIFCGYIWKQIGEYKEQQLQIASKMTSLQHRINTPSQASNPWPDNLDAMLEDLLDQIKAQKTVTSSIESLVVSDLKPQVYFLLKEYALQQKPLDLTKQHANYITGVLTKVLAEAELALRGMHNKTQAINLLEFAENILQQQDDPQYSQVKTAIAEDKQALAAVPVLDKATLWTRLAALLADVAKYEYKAAMAPAVATPTVALPAPSQDLQGMAKLQQELRHTWFKLKALVKITRNNNATAAVATFATLTEQTARDRLRLILEQARFASLTGEEKIYSASLREATELFTKYFPATAAVNQQAIAELESMVLLKLQTPMPERLLSLAELANLSKQAGLVTQ